MKVAYSIIISCLLVSCGNPKQSRPFKAFDFSYNDVFSTCFSIKFTQGDTVFIRQHFTNLDLGTLKENKTYYSIVEDDEKNTIDSYLNLIDFQTYNSKYIEGAQDGAEYQFYVVKNNYLKTIYVQGDNAPAQLHTFAVWLTNFKAKLNLTQIDTAIEFGSLKFFLPPHSQPPPINFTPPKIDKPD